MARKKAQKAPPNNRLIVLTCIIIIVAAILVAYKPKSAPSTETASMMNAPFDFTNQKIMLNHQELSFVDGSYHGSDNAYGQHTASIMHGSVNPSRTRAAAILTDNPGGSGTFSYIVGASLIDGKEVYSKPVLLGDRIKIASLSVDNAGPQDNGVITVKYLDRPANAPMSSEPTEEVAVKFAFQDDGNLIAVLTN